MDGGAYQGFMDLPSACFPSKPERKGILTVAQ
jgi:hypothetical protein